MKRLAWVALLALPCLLASCGMLQGPMRTIQSGFRTFTDAGDSSPAPPTLESSDPAALALRLSGPERAEIWSAPVPPRRETGHIHAWDQPIPR